MNKFEFSIVALDKYTKTFRDLNNKASLAVSPLVSAQKQISAIGREMHLSQVAKGLSAIASSGATIARGLGVATPALEGIAALGAGGGIAAAVAAIGALGARVGSLGTDVSRTGSKLGINTTQLQRFRGAAELAGLTVDDMDSSLTGLAKTMQDAKWGRNDAARGLMNIKTGGIALKPDGSIDVAAQMMRVSDAVKGIHDPGARLTFLSQMGVSENMLPLLRRGSGGVKGAMDEAESKGYVLRGDALATALKFNHELGELRIAFEGLANTVGVKVLPGLTSLTRDLASFFSHPISSLFFQHVGDDSSGSARSGGGGAFAPGAAAGAAGGAAGGRGPLGLRLNNPGNLTKWGSRPIVGGFAQFDSPAAGLNAMASQLEIYQDVHGLSSISGILNRYAPPSKNNTAAYISDVAGKTGFGADQSLDLHDPKQLASLMAAMVTHEQGRQPFTAEQYGAAASQASKMEITIKLPPGVSAHAKVDGAYVPTRIDRSMSTGSSVE